MNHTYPIPLVRVLTLGLLLSLGATRPLFAQIKTAESSAGAPRYGAPEVSRYRVGASIVARRGAVQKIRAMVAVPYPCDEQQVEVVDEDISEQVDSMTYRDLPGGARQMLIAVRRLPAGQEARAIITFEVRTRPILPPRETANLTIPQKPGRELKRFLGKSPYIEVGHRKIRAAVKDALVDLDETATDWQRVEAIYDYVQQTIDYLEGSDKSAVRTLKDRQGDCQAISALFVAMCRTEKIPARIVWVHEHNYPEFYLEEAGPEGAYPTESGAGSERVSTEVELGKDRPSAKRVRRTKKAATTGHWYPCESSGQRAFGEMPLARTVLQKGDSFKVPERPRERLRYASDFLIGLPTPGGGKPNVKYIHEQL
ncbi:MAG: transglutaminase family protein [Pirellulales bacterium]